MRPLLILAIAVHAALAQGPQAVLDGVRADLRAARERSRVPGPRELEGLVRRLSALEDAPSFLREEACRLLQGLLESGARGDEALRWRVAAVEVVARLAGKPEWVDVLFRTVLAGGRGSLRGLDFLTEPALGRLRSPAQVSAVLERLDARDDDEVRLALGALAAMEGDHHAALVESHQERILELAEDEDPGLRARALRLLARLDVEGGVERLIAAAAADEVPTRRAAATGLGHRVGRPDVDAALADLLEDPSARVREEAAVAFRRSPVRKQVPLLVARLAREPLRIRAELNTTLRALTGFDFGPEHEPWAGWLRTARASGALKAPAGQTPPPERTRYGVRYYDIPVLSDRVLFVLDISGSMGFNVGETSKTPDRMDRAKKELVSVLESLDERTFFNVLFFSSLIAPLSGDGLMPATPRNVELAVRSVLSQRARGGTNSHGALQAAFELYPSVDTIYFLSDGSPSSGRTTVPERIVQDVFGWNRLRGVRIHTIALLEGELLDPFRRASENKDDAARFMRLLAEQTGGRFRDIR